MTDAELPQAWSRRFGLALAPLFEDEEMENAIAHHVLLDGGFGTFALSTSTEKLWHDANPAAWVWSGDIPHHVTITPNEVAVLRWDRPDDPRIFSRSSVERSLDGFYEYLTKDRLRSTNTVVDHLLGFFRRVRSLNHSAGLPDDRTTDVFLSALARMIWPNEGDASIKEAGLAEDILDLQKNLNPKAMNAAAEEAKRSSGSSALLRLYPSLAVRHAGGQLFQEAHFELLRASTSLDLFGVVGTPEVAQTTRGGTHFTPPALARVLVEQALKNLAEVSSRKTLTLCDPACGSGAFLHEALRALRRKGFSGRLTIVGQDISRAAVSMARFAISASLRDWTPPGGIDLQLNVGDSLGDQGMPRADLIVMNPPFLGFGAQSEIQREQLRKAVGGQGAARGDLSMAFMIRALEALKPNGVVGALFPASLLSLKAAATWRERLADGGDVRLLGSIGDFGLFSHAQVQVACAVVRKGLSPPNSEITALVTGNDTQATGEAFRWLRKMEGESATSSRVEAEWRIFPVPAEGLRNRPTWRFPSPEAEQALRALDEARFPTIGDLFDVRQGIQTGLNDALLLTRDEWQKLPLKERRFFRLATMSDSIQNGRISSPYHLFYPHTESGPLFSDEPTLRAAVPNYFKQFLEPNRDRLTARATIRHAKRIDWWGLMRPRAWSFSSQPRIISKFFAAQGGFAGDYDAVYVPVMGHAWFAKAPLTEASTEGIDQKDILAAYVALFNSGPYLKLVEIFSPHVAGGQFDLSGRYVAGIPTPNLRELSLDLTGGRVVLELAELGRAINLADQMWLSRNASLVNALYGARLSNL